MFTMRLSKCSSTWMGLDRISDGMEQLANNIIGYLQAMKIMPSALSGGRWEKRCLLES